MAGRNDSAGSAAPTAVLPAPIARTSRATAQPPVTGMTTGGCGGRDVHAGTHERRRRGGTPMTESGPTARLSGSTAWGRNVQTPLRDFLRTETGSAAVLLAATVAAVAWVNIDAASYNATWHATLSIRLGRRRTQPGPSPLGQQRPHDVLLLRHRAGGAPRVRHGRTAREAAGHASAGRRHQRDDRAGPHLPRHQLRPRLGPRLGRGDVDGHGVRARPACPRRRAQPRSSARVPAHHRGHRRHRRTARHRDRLHGPPHPRPIGWLPSACSSSFSSCVLWA